MSAYVNTLESYFLQQGRQEGKQQTLKSLLEKRFGALPSWVSEKIAAASAEILERWLLQLLDARSLDDVFV